MLNSSYRCITASTFAFFLFLVIDSIESSHLRR